MVVDLKRSGFNATCISPEFRYGDFRRHLAQCAQCAAPWAATWDFKSFYHSIKLHKDLWKWMTVRGSHDRLLCFTSVPFGANWACHTASLIMAEVLAVLSSFGFNLSFGYIDDGRVAAKTQDEADHGLLAAVAVAVGGGLQI